jgi:hypothetical protein
MQRLRVLQLVQPVSQALLVQQELPELLEPLVCKSSGWKPELQLGEQRVQVLQPEVQLVEQRLPAAQPEALPLLALLAQLLLHWIRRK